MAGSRHKPYAATSQLSRPGSGRDFDWPPRATQTLFLRQLRWLEVRESRTADNTLHSDPSLSETGRSWRAGVCVIMSRETRYACKAVDARRESQP